MMKPRIGVLTSGGDCPGLNAVLRGVVLAAEKLGWEVVGFRDGFEGLLPPGNHVILDRKSINGIMALGGTIIGTTNRGHFVAKVGAGDRTIVPANVIASAKKILDELQVRALLIVGVDIILMHESRFHFDKIAGVIKAREAADYLGAVVVVAEGARPKHGEQVRREVEGGEFRLGGIGGMVAHEIAERTGKESRCCV